MFINIIVYGYDLYKYQYKRFMCHNSNLTTVVNELNLPASTIRCNHNKSNRFTVTAYEKKIKWIKQINGNIIFSIFSVNGQFISKTLELNF